MSGASNPKQHERGFTLIEVMVSMGMFSIGALGVVAMQVLAINSNKYSSQMSQCVLYAEAQATSLMARKWDDTLVADSSTTDELNSTDFKPGVPTTADPSGVADSSTKVLSMSSMGVVDASFSVDSPFQLYWQVDDLDQNSVLDGTDPDMKRIRVACRFLDRNINQWREVALVVLKSKILT